MVLVVVFLLIPFISLTLPCVNKPLYSEKTHMINIILAVPFGFRKQLDKPLRRLTVENDDNLMLPKIIKLGINGQLAPHGSIPVDPNHFRVPAVVSQCHKYSSNIF